MFFFASRSPLYSAPKLDLGAEYRFRHVQLTNITYTSELPVGSGRTKDQSYYSHRARIYMKGKLDPGLEIGTVLQAIGVAGSSVPFLGRYPSEDFTPFIENAYIQANDIIDWPVSITVGRQPYVWGSGLLISDDGLGFDAIRMDVGPYWGIRTHFMTAKTKYNQSRNNNGDLYLVGIERNFGIHKVMFGWIRENDNSGLPYANLLDTTTVKSDKISRQFLDIQLSGRLEKGAFYNLEYARQGGKAIVPGKEISLGGNILTFEGGFDFLHPRYKRMVLAFVFSQSDGDDTETTAEDERFQPSFGRKFDGLERKGYGEFFAATPYSFFNEDKIDVIVFRQGTKIITHFPYTSLFSGLRIFGFRGSVQPIEDGIAGLEFYLYNAREGSKVGNRTPADQDDLALGRELIITAAYRYAKKINISIRYGQFFPNVNLNDVGSRRIILEVSGRF